MDQYEVIFENGTYRIILAGDELYRDDYGTLKKRHVTKKIMMIVDTPIEAQIIADRWNREDRDAANQKQS